MNAFRFGYRVRILIMLLLIVINCFIFVNYFWTTSDASDVDHDDEAEQQQKASSMRLNRLLHTIHTKEAKYRTVLDKLHIMQFDQFGPFTGELLLAKPQAAHATATNVSDPHHPLSLYKHEIDTYLNVDPASGLVTVTEQFVHELASLSADHGRADAASSAQNNASQLVANLLGVRTRAKKTMIVTAANSSSYSHLQAALYHIHLYLPDYPIIVYDLGLTPLMHDKTKKKCRCELRKFDANGAYARVSPHIADHTTFAWKPLVIQEVLKEHESLIYIDVSVRFHSGLVEPALAASRRVGIITRFTNAKLTCFAHTKTVEWFGATDAAASAIAPAFASQALLLKTNFMAIERNFLTALVLKAWVTCALERECIAPVGASPTGGLVASVFGCSASCDCHRYDRAAISFVCSHFYGLPAPQTNRPLLNNNNNNNQGGVGGERDDNEFNNKNNNNNNEAMQHRARSGRLRRHDRVTPSSHPVNILALNESNFVSVEHEYGMHYF